MVNKAPSRGCHKCRERHIKCDHTKPHCQRCTARNIVCPGYRDANGFVFKDQGPKLAAKHSGKEVALPKKRESPEPEPRPTFDSAVLLAGDPEAYCISFFFRSYILCKKDPRASRGHFDHVIPFFASAEPDSAMALATIALSVRFTAMFFRYNRQTALHNSTSLRATKAIRNALADPVHSLSDETLQAVILLELAAYMDNVSTCEGAHDRHLDGAVAIIQHRGIDDFTSPASKALLIATVDHSLHHALFYKMKPFFDELLASKIVNGLASTIGKRLNLIMARLVWLRAELVECRGSSNHDRIRLLRASAREIAKQLDGFMESMPREWLPVHNATDDGEAYETWAGLDEAFIFNLWRASKLLLFKLEYIISMYDDLSSRHKSITTTDARTEANGLVDALCKTSTFFLQPRESTSDTVDDSYSKQFSAMKRPRNARMPTTAAEASERTPGYCRWMFLKVLNWVCLAFDDAQLDYDEFVILPEARGRVTGLITLLRDSLAQLDDSSRRPSAASIQSSRSETSDYAGQHRCGSLQTST